MEYLVISKWCGIFGGWGSESDIAALMNRQATEGWQLTRTEPMRAFWFWALPRTKLLMIFERQVPSRAEREAYEAARAQR